MTYKLYVIVNMTQFNDNYVMLNSSLIRGFTDARKSKDLQLVLIPIPSTIPEVFLTERIYTKDDVALLIASDPNWTDT